MPEDIEKLNGLNFRSKTCKYGSVYFTDLFNSMFLVVVDIPNRESEDMTRTFVYSNNSKTQQRTNARHFYNQVKESLVKGDYKSIEEMIL